MKKTAGLLCSSDEIAALLAQIRRVAVLGARSEAYRDRPAFYVPAALATMGLEVMPVALHEPKVTHILGKVVYRSLAEIPGEIDLVDVFRRPADLPAHLDDFLAKRPRAVWFQSGIRNDEVADSLVKAGIAVVQDRCLMLDYRRFASREA